MNIKSKKKFRAVTSLGIGVILLTCAVFANFESANGYTDCKDAVKKLLNQSNVSMDMTFKVQIDGEELEASNISYMYNLGGNPIMRSEETIVSPDSDPYFRITQLQDNIRIYVHPDGGNYHYRSSEANSYVDYYRGKTVGGQVFMTDQETTDKIYGFAESIGDVLVGDLKNSLVPLEKADGIRTYGISLTGAQMPAYVNSGVSLVTSLFQQELTDAEIEDGEPTAKLFASGEPYIRDASGKFMIDESGNIVAVLGELNFIGYDAEGGEHTLTMSFDMEVYDVGTTEIPRFTEEELKKLEKY